ncbi:PAS domain-containing protein [Rhizobium sp. CSW-27]|nr:PAS domain-containing protein [Rhizobium sp. CSW-27]
MGTVTRQDTLSFLQGGGRSAGIMHDIDWSRTPLGPMERWPVALKTAVGMVLTSGFPATIAWGPDLTMIYNDAFRPILGRKPEAMGQPFGAVWSEVWAEMAPVARKALAGEATFVEDFPLTVQRNGYAEEAFFTFSYSPLRDDDGRIVGLLDTVIETTARVASQRQVRLMNSELQHRMKNMFAMVTSIASQTLRVAHSVEESRALLLQRLAAVANAHALVTDAPKGDVPVAQVLETALAAHRTVSGQVQLQGPKVMLSEKQALSLSLAINELTTNAMKYGALSVENGRVEVSWRGNGHGPFELHWHEQGGPPVTKPSRRGFGTTLMERVVPHDFGGSAELTYAPEGLSYRIISPALKR